MNKEKRNMEEIDRFIGKTFGHRERADFIVRRLGDKGANVSSFIENLVRIHLEEYGEDIEKWRKL